MSKLKWIKPERVLGKTIASMIDVDEMLASFLKCGLIDEVTGNYSRDVYDMCRNGATWLAAQLAQITDEVQVIEGTYEGFSHVWCVVGDYYFDTTIAQSIPDAPKFACIRQKNATGYSEFMRFSVNEWVQIALRA